MNFYLSRAGTLALVCGVYLASGVTLAALGPNLPTLAANVGYGVAVIGGQFAAFSFGTIMVQLAAAPIGIRYGQRAVLGLGTLLLGLGILGESLSRALWLLLVCAGVGGLGFGCILAAGSVLVPRLFPARGTSALNVVNLFFGVGSILGPLAAGWAGALLGLPQAALWLGAGLLLALLPLTPLALEVSPSHQHSAGASRDGGVPWRLVLLLGLFLAIYSGTEIALGGWTLVFLQASTDLAPEQGALVVAGFWLALTVGRAMGAVLGLQLRARTLLLLALGLLLGGASILAASVGDPANTIIGLLILGLACGPVFPTTMALVASVAGGRSSATGLALAVGNLGGATVPPVLGLVLTGAGPQAAAGLVLGLAITLLALLGVAGGAAANLWRRHDAGPAQ